MKIKNIKKFIRSILIVLGIIGILSLILTQGALSHTDTSYTTISVSSGDTLWKIAEKQQSSNDYYKGKDIRYIIDDLVEINHLSSKDLAIDQKLQVPEM